MSLKAQKVLLKLKGYKDVCFYKSGDYRMNDTEYLKINDLNNNNDLFTICLKNIMAKEYSNVEQLDLPNMWRMN